MFTGIVTDVGQIARCPHGGAVRRLAHRLAPTTPPTIALGASIACAGRA